MTVDLTPELRRRLQAKIGPLMRTFGNVGVMSNMVNRSRTSTPIGTPVIGETLVEVIDISI